MKITEYENLKFRLDNAANIFPASSTSDHTRTFALSLKLKENVDEKILMNALEKALTRLPLFNSKIIESDNNYYFVQNPEKAIIHKGINHIFTPFDENELKGYQWKLFYDKNQIILECTHAITDANGGMVFLGTILGEYIKQKYNEDISYGKNVLNINDKPSENEFSDDYIRFKRKKTYMQPEKKAYQVSGTELAKPKVIQTGFEIDLNSLKEQSKKCNATIGEFLASLLFYCIQSYREKYDSKKNEPSAIQLAIDLRKYYDSHTLNNFISYMNQKIDVKKHYSLPEIIELVKENFKAELDEEKLNRRFTLNVAGTENIIMQKLPMSLKKKLFKFVENKCGENYFTCMFSNLNRVSFSKEIDQYVENVKFLMGRCKNAFGSIGCVSFNNKVNFTFTRRIREDHIEKLFESTLKKLNINYKIVCDETYKEINDDFTENYLHQ